MIRANLAENLEEHPFNVLRYALICYNNRKNKTHGITPYELIFEHTSDRAPETLYNPQKLIPKCMGYYYKLIIAKSDAQISLRLDEYISKSV